MSKILTGAFKRGKFHNSEEKAMAVTASFEGPDNFSTLTGSFDQMGISFGFLQWNLGKGTLQPLIRAMAQASPAEFKRCFTQPVAQFGGKVMDLSDDILKVCAMSSAEAVKWAEARQDDKFRLHKHWVDAFKALGQVPAFQAVQRQFAKPYMDRAKRHMTEYGFVGERALVFMFDVCVQCGSITAASKRRYEAINTKGMSEKQRLLELSKAIGPQAGRWEQNVRRRKDAIAIGGGIVHGVSYNMETDFGITDARAVFA